LRIWNTIIKHLTCIFHARANNKEINMTAKTVADLSQQFEALSALVDDLRNDGLTGVNFETNVGL